jgi:hypothetical protein
MDSRYHFPKPILDREGDSRIITVPAWYGKYPFVVICLFTFLMLLGWIHAFLLPLLSEWGGAAPTLNAGQKVSGWVWTLILLGLPYYVLYLWKGRLVLIASPDRLLWVRDMVLFRIRREYVGRGVRNLRWSMPDKIIRPLGMQPANVVNGSILCDYEGRAVMLTGVLPAKYGRPLVEALAEVYAKAPARQAEANLEPVNAHLSSRTDIQERNGTLRILRSGQNLRMAGFLTLFSFGWSVVGFGILSELGYNPFSAIRSMANSGHLFSTLMMLIFLAFWSLMTFLLIPVLLYNLNGREELEVDEVGMLHRKRYILFSTSRRFPRKVLSNVRITDTGVSRFESANDRQNRAFWGESSLALAFDVAGKTRRIFVGASREEFDAIEEGLARVDLSPAKSDTGPA